jgi:hypothetical protein
VKGVHSFLGHAGFYQTFIQNFSQILDPHASSSQRCPVHLHGRVPSIIPHLEEGTHSTPVIQPPDWHLPFEIMCDASDYAVGVVLSQSKDKKHYAISYTSKTLIRHQLNYVTTEKELLAMVLAIKKFRSYLVGTKVIVYTDHAALMAH